MRNRMSDLNNHLFEQLERLNDDGVKGDSLREEIERARAMSSIATQIIANGTLSLRAIALKDAALDANFKLPPALES